MEVLAGTTGYWKARPNAIGHEQSIALSQRRCNVLVDAFDPQLYHHDHDTDAHRCVVVHRRHPDQP